MHPKNKRLMQIAEWGHAVETKQLTDNNFMSALHEMISDSQPQENNQLIDQLRQLSGVNEPSRVMYFPDTVVPLEDRRRNSLAGRQGRPGGQPIWQPHVLRAWVDNKRHH